MPSITISLLLLCGCGSSSLCSAEPDLSGNWTFRFEPPPSGNGIPREDVVTAEFGQVQPSGPFSLGRLIWGSFTSMDKGFFDVLQIPRLMNNGGSKTGSILGCNLHINVPTGIVQDDNTPPPMPLALSLQGSVIQQGLMASSTTSDSTVLMNENGASEVFAWSASRQ